MITGGPDNSAETIRNLDRIQLVSDVIHRGVTGGEHITVPETFVGVVVGGRDPLELAQVVILHCLNSTLRLTGRCRRLRSRGGAKVEVVLDVGTEAAGISDRRGVGKGVAIDAVGERVSIRDVVRVTRCVSGRVRCAGVVVAVMKRNEFFAVCESKTLR